MVTCRSANDRQAMVVSLLRLGNSRFSLGWSSGKNPPWIRPHACFPWVLLFISLTALALGCIGFVWILKDQDVYQGKILVVTAVSTIHGFLACCCSLRHMYEGYSKAPKNAGFYVLCFNFASTPASALVLLCSSTTTFLLVGFTGALKKPANVSREKLASLSCPLGYGLS